MTDQEHNLQKNNFDFRQYNLQSFIRSWNSATH